MRSSYDMVLRDNGISEYKKAVLEREYRMIFELHYPTPKDFERSHRILELLGYEEETYTEEEINRVLKHFKK